MIYFLALSPESSCHISSFAYSLGDSWSPADLPHAHAVAFALHLTLFLAVEATQGNGVFGDARELLENEQAVELSVHSGAAKPLVGMAVAF